MDRGEVFEVFGKSYILVYFFDGLLVEEVSWRFTGCSANIYAVAVRATNMQLNCNIVVNI